MSKPLRTVGPAIGLVMLLAPIASGTVSFNWKTIGSPGNASDPATGLGSVGYEYRISATEVTNAQYASFLNSVAASDPFGLYDTDMANSYGGITRSGTAGSYTYAAAPGRENNPVVYVSYFDAMRFTNWLHNGQGAGGTETGAYTISDGLSETRSANAQYFLPSMDEWQKAAFHQPAIDGGDVDDFWTYATQSNSAPVAGVDANFGGVVGNSTAVGSYASNYYDLYDMAGNVSEWNERVIAGLTRAVIGGSWAVTGGLEAGDMGGIGPGSDGNQIGFRVASAIPAPGTGALGAAMAGLAMRRRRG